MSRHSALTDAHLHRPGYYQTGDPGAIGAGKVWINTTATPYVLSVRNAADDGWVTVGGFTNAEIAATAEIAVSKLANGSAQQLLQTDAAGTGVEWTSNIDIPGTLDVTGAAVFDSTVSMGALTATTITATGLLQVTLTSEQARLRCSATEYQSITVGATGTTAFAKVTAGTKLYTFDAGISVTSASGVPFIAYRSGLSSVQTYANVAGLQLNSYQSHVGPPYTKLVDIVANADAGAAGALRILTTPTGGTPTEAIRVDKDGKVGIGTTTVSAKLHVIATTEQARLGYDVNNRLSVTVSSVGLVTYAATGSGAAHTFGSQAVSMGALTATTLAGTLSTAAQPNVTSLGTLTSLNVGDITATGAITVDHASDAYLTVDRGTTGSYAAVQWKTADTLDFSAYVYTASAYWALYAAGAALEAIKVACATGIVTFGNNIVVMGNVTANGDFNHDGANFGALGATPAPQRAHQADATDLATAISAVNYALATLETFGFHAAA